jgi:hypothetical protein
MLLASDTTLTRLPRCPLCAQQHEQLALFEGQRTKQVQLTVDLQRLTIKRNKEVENLKDQCTRVVAATAAAEEVAMCGEGQLSLCSSPSSAAGAAAGGQLGFNDAGETGELMCLAVVFSSLWYTIVRAHIDPKQMQNRDSQICIHCDSCTSKCGLQLLVRELKPVLRLARD